MTDEFTKPSFIWQKPTFWAGDKEILQYRRQKLLKLTAILAIGNDLSPVKVCEAMYAVED